MDVTAFLVTRNHEASIGRTLKSIEGLASEILVIDTGSTDQTVSLASSLGASIVYQEWHDDFSTVCNHALAVARSTWILQINPDEILDPAGRAILNVTRVDESALAARMRIQHHLKASPQTPGTVEWQIRLFRKHPEIRYAGRLYPRFQPNLNEVAQSCGKAIVTIDATIHHLAFFSTQTPDKLRWAVRLLRAELADHPGQLNYEIELARHLIWLGENEGQTLMIEISKQILAHEDSPTPSHPEIAPLLEYLLSNSDLQQKTSLKPDQLRTLALKWFPLSPPLRWAIASERFRNGDYQEAAKQLEVLLHMGQTGEYLSHGGFDPEIMASTAMLNLAACQLQLGQFELAKVNASSLFKHPNYSQQALAIYAKADKPTSV